MKRNLSGLGISFTQAKLKQITDIAHKAGLRMEELRPLGHYKAKVALDVLNRLESRPYGKLICISGITPTSSGEGKTCTSIGLTQALGLLKKRVILCLREPSLAPIFGNKGGATGARYSQVLPADDINLHFTGDIHAVELATNLLAAVIDNHRHHGNSLDIDPNQILWRRSLDICDRQLRQVTVGMSKACEQERGLSAFDITPASEIMAILSLSKDLADLKNRLSKIVVALSRKNKPITAADLKTVGALTVLLKDALEPNLVQTLEGQPCLIHTGPFANVSHGNNSILATQMALKLADYAVTESGFGSDLGLEKLFDLVCSSSGFTPSIVVLVVTIKALKSHAPGKGLKNGFENLEHHLQNIHNFGLDAVVAINRFPQDTDEEIEQVKTYLSEKKIPAAESHAVEKGGVGAVELAETVLKILTTKKSNFKPLYSQNANSTLEEKCRLIAQRIYGAEDVVFSDEAKKDLDLMRKLGFSRLPVNIAKTPLSISDNNALKGAPKGWKLHIRALRVFAGAGYVIALSGKLMLMPGLSKTPMLEKMDVDEKGNVIGVSV